jgi:hypothetical protein
MRLHSLVRPALAAVLLVAFFPRASAAEEPQPSREGFFARSLRTVGLKRTPPEASKSAPSPSPLGSPGASPTETLLVQPESARAKPGFFRRAINVLPFVGDDAPKRPEDAVRAEGLSLTAALDPGSVSLAARRTVEVTVTVRNTTKRAVVLSFPTSQRLEILLRGAGGQSLGRWSEDQVFAQETGYLAINPGERAEYRETLSLRGIKSAGAYNVEVYIAGHPGLAQTLALEVAR